MLRFDLLALIMLLEHGARILNDQVDDLLFFIDLEAVTRKHFIEDSRR